jgi:hypothetical protein
MHVIPSRADGEGPRTCQWTPPPEGVTKIAWEGSLDVYATRDDPRYDDHHLRRLLSYFTSQRSAVLLIIAGHAKRNFRARLQAHRPQVER